MKMITGCWLTLLALCGLGFPQAVDPGWMKSVQQNIQREEYFITWQDETPLQELGSAYQAPNRAQGFRTTFTEDGIRVVPRTTEGSTWEWGLALVPLPVASNQQSVDSGATHSLPTTDCRLPATVSGNRIEFDRGWITEWYVNSPEGLEQGFTIHQPPGKREMSDVRRKTEGRDLSPLTSHFPSILRSPAI